MVVVVLEVVVVVDVVVVVLDVAGGVVVVVACGTFSFGAILAGAPLMPIASFLGIVGEAPQIP